MSTDLSRVDDTTNIDSLRGDEKILAEAKKRFKRCQQWESVWRQRALDDQKFADADPDNGWQWPNDIRSQREVDKRPSLTINKVRQHNLQIINDAKQNKPGVKIRPVGNGATFDAAQVYDGVVRHIEYISNAEQAYDTATTSQVKVGIGYWRLVVDYAGPNTLDQEIFIRRIKDWSSVYLDPDIQEIDGSDASYGFIFTDMSKDEAKEAYPKFKGKFTQSPLSNTDGWLTKDYVRIAEYFRKVKKKDKLLHFMDPATRQYSYIRESKLPDEIKSAIVDDPQTKSRDLEEDGVEWFMIIADEVADRTDWVGKYIPIVRIVGEESIIEGTLDRKGHTRAMKDAQRMYNYWTSAAVEHVALQSKSPYIASLRAIEGLETYWETANRVNHSVLIYNDISDDGNPVQQPQRAGDIQFPQAYITGMTVAQQELMMVSGQYQAQMGENENAKSGVAINARQRQGDNATYHFIDGLAIGIRFTGKQLIDLIPKVYDTERVIKIMAEDGVEKEVMVNPVARQSYLEQQQRDSEKVKIIFNPNVGEYDVMADIGPSYATRRQEAWNAFKEITTGNPDLIHVVGDIMFRNADFPGADFIAERLRRLVPPQALGDAPPPELQQAQGQLQALQNTLTELTRHLADKELELKKKDVELEGKNLALSNKDAENMIRAYGAESQRITALSNAQPEMSKMPGGTNELQTMIKKTVQDIMGKARGPAQAGQAAPAPRAAPAGPAPAAVGAPDPSGGPDTTEQPPIPGARKAPDGNWYVDDPRPHRQGKYMKVEVGA